MPQLVHVGRLMGARRGGGGGIPAWVLAGSSFDADFVNNQYYDGADDTFANIFTVARAAAGFAQDSTGLFVNFTANQARRTDLGLFTENAATNVVQQNVGMTTGWTNTNSAVTTGQASPDGGTSAVSINDGAVSAAHSNSAPSFSFANATNYCSSVIAKAGTDSRIQLTFGSAAFSGLGYANFDLAGGTVTATGGTLVNSGIASVGNGWYLCWITALSTAAAGTGGIAIARINSGSAARVPSYAGTSTTVLLWLPQTETGTFPSSRISNPASASATRAADNITVTAAAAQTAIYAAKSAYSETNGCAINPALANVVCNINAALLRASSSTAMQTYNGTLGAAATIASAGTIASAVNTAWGFDGVNLTAVANSGTKAITAATWGATSGTITVGNLAALNRGLMGYLKRLSFSAVSGNYDPVASLYTGQVTTATRVPNAVSSGIDHQYQTRTPVIVRDTITQLQVVLPGWYWDQTTHAEIDAPNDITYTASVEYPVGVLAGVFKFSGVDAGICTAGSNLVSDALTGLNIPTGSRAWIWVHADAGLGFYVYNAAVGSPAKSFVDDLNGGATKFGLLVTDQTQTLGALVPTQAGQNGNGTFPLALIGPTRKASVFLLGDSRNAGYGDTYDGSGDLGELARSVGQSVAYINAGCSGDQAVQYVASNSKRTALGLAYCSHMVCELGINDAANGRTLPQIQADLASIYTLFVTKYRYQSTVHVNTTSTDDWATTGNQTPTAAATVVNNLNSWILAGALNGSFNVSGVLTTSAVWSATGAAFGYTLDGIHESPAGYALILSNGVINPAVFVR